MVADARLAQRLPLRCAASVTLLDGTRLDAQTRDLSAGGIGLLLASQLRLAQLCAVRFDANIDGAVRKVLAMGQVVYSEAADGGFQTGIHFIQLDADSQAAVTALLRAAPGIQS